MTRCDQRCCGLARFAAAFFIPAQPLLDLLNAPEREFIALTDASPLFAAAMGAEVVEVHVTMSRQMFGPDVPASAVFCPAFPLGIGPLT